MMDMQAGWLGIPTPEVSAPDDNLDDGKLIAITGLTGTIIHTPGHTEGSSCLYLPDNALLIAGDTLFAGSVGRTDLPGGNTRTLLQSIHNRLLTLPDEIKSHSPDTVAATTIGEERENNPFLQS